MRFEISTSIARTKLGRKTIVIHRRIVEKNIHQ